jgi:Zn-finger nucleic acid-binding protein
MKCPTCNESSLVMSDRQGIEIDYCPQCRGVWLDRGELDKIIDRSASPEAPPASRAQTQHQPPQQHHQQHQQPVHRDERSYPQHDPRQGYGRDGYGYKKKKNFLGELFDFD